MGDSPWIDGPVGGRGLQDPGLPSRTFPPGRLCEEPGCETLLSIYNDNTYCSLHESKKPRPIQAKRSANLT